MRLFRTRAEKLGGHYHVRFFTADNALRTWAGIGTLVMDEEDYRSLKLSLKGDHLLEEKS